MSVIDQVKSGEHARLIPVLPDSRREEKATASLLGAFRVIPEFAREVLQEAGAAIGARAKIDCYTEVVFKGESAKGMRPDGLIVVHTGKREWSALVESKIGNASLSSEQLEKYLGVAKDLGIDAVITISNDYAVLPTHHPVSVSKQALKKVDLFHFSWLSIISKGILLSDNSVVTDPEQAFILAELIRYFRAPSSGVSALTKMSAEWRDVCDHIQKGAALQRSSRELEGAVGSWNQLMRYLSLQLSMATSSAVKLVLPRRLQGSPEAQVKEAVEAITKTGQVSAILEVPNAAAPITFTADFMRRTIFFDMRLTAPQDIKRPTAAINWLTRQLKGVENPSGVLVRVYWPKRISTTMGTLAQALAQPDSLVPPDCREIPKEIEISVMADLAGKFRGAKTFIEESERELVNFYDRVGEHLTAWQPRAPLLRSSRVEAETQSVDDGLIGSDVNASEDGESGQGSGRDTVAENNILFPHFGGIG